MHQTIQSVIEAIDAITSVSTEEEDEYLWGLIDDFYDFDEAEQHLEVWFRLYERFPEVEINSFWHVLHKLEHFEQAEPLTVVSIQRMPSIYTVMILNRLLNARLKAIDGISLLKLLELVTTARHTPPKVRALAEEYVKYQKYKPTDE
ncbi:MAG TPA: hypothetical protein PLX97_09730 [Gemmatales bacterium]|nr:hypothetical protein [Gemmatales bacterium]